MTLQGHPRSLILAPIESAYNMTSYWTSIVTLVLSCRVSEILELLYLESRYFDAPLIFRPKFRGVPFGKIRDVGSAKSEHPMQTNSEIISEDFFPTYVITVPQRHGWTLTDDLL